MSYSIGNISGYFDGYSWYDGPFIFEIKGDKIVEIQNDNRKADIDAHRGFLSVPFTDGHTHLIFAGDRSFELDLKIKGASYADILEQGGGILNTVTHTRESSDQQLMDLLLERLDLLLAHGTLLVEAKSGYGLKAEQEIRLLEILNDITHSVEIIPTYCGAHALPQDKNRKDYVEEVISLLPEIKSKGLATSTDVFCDRGAFSVDETREIFVASKEHDIPIRVHAEEIQYTGIGKIAAKEFQALSVDHLLLSKVDDFKVYSDFGTTAMFMPAATIGLFTKHKPQGWDIEGLNIGLGSDYNPNNLVVSMQTAIRLAVYLYGMTPSRAFQAGVSGSFKGIMGSELPKLTIGSEASFILVNANSIDQFTTRFDQNLVKAVVKDGEFLINKL